jgi:nicotinate dehydrogenase subunit B
MTASPRAGARFFERTGALLVLRAPHATHRVGEAVLTAPIELDHDAMELFLAMGDDGEVTAFNGHVDLGTGIRTALAQIVAEELDVAVSRVTVVLGHTALAPNQGATIASETLQVTAVPLRQAAAQARRCLLARAAAELGAGEDELRVDDGIVHLRGSDNRFVSYADLLRGERIRLVLGDAVATKPVEGLHRGRPADRARRHPGQGVGRVRLCP